MSVASEVSYVRRFTVKLVEIVAAGIGTAVSGYLVAYITGHISFFSFFAPAKVETPPPQAISSAAAPVSHTASIEATVRAALAGHDGSRDGSDTAPSATTPQPVPPQQPAQQSPAPASPETQASIPVVAPPLATAEIRSMPVAVPADPPLQAEQDGWPSDPRTMSDAGRMPSNSGYHMLPPQPPPANFHPLTVFKHLF